MVAPTPAPMLVELDFKESSEGERTMLLRIHGDLHPVSLPVNEHGAAAVASILAAFVQARIEAWQR